MKKTILASAVLITLLAACKKDRTCTCTTLRTGTTTTQGTVTQSLFGFPITLADTSFSEPYSDIQTYDKQLSDVTKKSAEANCASYTQPYNEKTITSVPSSSFGLALIVTNKGEEKVDCKLK